VFLVCSVILSFWFFIRSFAVRNTPPTNTKKEHVGASRSPRSRFDAEIINPPEGELCFLCTVTNGIECVWPLISEDIVSYGRRSAIRYEDREQNHSPLLTLEEFHKACHYACYRRYIFTVSNWSTGMGRIRIPTCIETGIRNAFPGNGVFVGFQPNERI